jgi:hypothetical protein
MPAWLGRLPHVLQGRAADRAQPAEGVPLDGRDHRASRHLLALDDDSGARVVGEHEACSYARPDRALTSLDEGLRGTAEEIAERHTGQAQRRAGPGAQHALEHGREGRGGSDVDPFVHRGTASAHSISTSRGCPNSQPFGAIRGPQGRRWAMRTADRRSDALSADHRRRPASKWRGEGSAGHSRRE